jgi:hypothetical protein
MEFSIDGSRSVTFEFVYQAYTINVADYLSESGKPEGKISVMVQRYGQDLSSKTVERLAAYVNERIDGVAIACNNVIELNIRNTDQFMVHLFNAINLLLHG